MDKITITPKESIDITSFKSTYLPLILDSETFMSDLLQHYDHLDTIQLLLICYYQIVPNENVKKIGLENMELKDLLNVFIDEEATRSELINIFSYQIKEGLSFCKIRMLFEIKDVITRSREDS